MLDTSTKRHEDLMGAIARGYCSPVNSSKVLDPELCSAIASEIEEMDSSIKSSKEYADVQRALLCLNLEAPASVVADVKAKVDALLARCLG